MDFKSTGALRRGSAVLPAAALLSCTLLIATAQADVGVERVSRSAGVPGDAVKLTLGCGFCHPPCRSAMSARRGPCMPSKKAPPASFPVSLVPIEKAPKPHRCGPNALCSPQTRRPPSRYPFTLLGRATPPRHGDGKEHPKDDRVPRYLLSFTIPQVRPGVYTFVIYCDACGPGKGGGLIANPRARAWRLRVRAADRRRAVFPAGAVSPGLRSGLRFEDVDRVGGGVLPSG